MVEKHSISVDEKDWWSFVDCQRKEIPNESQIKFKKEKEKN